MTLYEQLLEDLAAEQAALDAVLGGITDTQWDLPIPSVLHAGRRRLRLGCIRRRDLPRSAMLRPASLRASERPRGRWRLTKTISSPLASRASGLG